jgi:selenocysteine lyase/cysteine desulfurase
MTYSEARALFPMLDRLAYLNTGSAGPLATPVLEAMRAEEERAVREGRGAQATFKHTMRLREVARARLAELVGVEAGSVALTASTTDGCNIVLAGLGLGPGDEVVTTDAEHFGLIGPLHASGARVVVCPPDPDALLAAVGARTRLLAVSHVTWTTGVLLPVAELRARAGIPVLVDGAQSVGAIAATARGVDFYTLSGQKWLCGPDGTGALVVAAPEELRVARPSYLSQASHSPDGSFVPKDGAARFDPSWLSGSLLAGLLAAIELRPAWGYDRAAELTARCRALLEDVVEVLPGDATLVAFRPPEGEEPGAVVERLAAAGVIIRELPGRNLLRASVGWWTDESDLQRLAESLSAV